MSFGTFCGLAVVMLYIRSRLRWRYNATSFLRTWYFQRFLRAKLYVLTGILRYFVFVIIITGCASSSTWYSPMKSSKRGQYEQRVLRNTSIYRSVSWKGSLTTKWSPFIVNDSIHLNRFHITWLIYSNRMGDVCERVLQLLESEGELSTHRQVLRTCNYLLLNLEWKTPTTGWVRL